MPFPAFTRARGDTAHRANPRPPDGPPDIYEHFVANGYRTTYANLMKSPQWQCGGPS